MPFLVRNLPFFKTRTTVIVRGREVPVKADQIAVWMSLAEEGRDSLDPDQLRFPAILDTGHTHNFSIREQQLVEWAGLDSRLLAKLGEIRIGNDRLPLLAADAWLYPNLPGKREVASGRPPFCLELDEGIAVYPRAMTTAPRLPLLGLRALRLAGLRLVVDRPLTGGRTGYAASRSIVYLLGVLEVSSPCSIYLDIWRRWSGLKWPRPQAVNGNGGVYVPPVTVTPQPVDNGNRMPVP